MERLLLELRRRSPSWRWDGLHCAFGAQEQHVTDEFAELVRICLRQAGARYDFARAIDVVEVIDHINGVRINQDIEDATILTELPEPSSLVRGMLMDRIDKPTILTALYWRTNFQISREGLDWFEKLFFDIEMMDIQSIQTWLDMAGYDAVVSSPHVAGRFKELYWRWSEGMEVEFDTVELTRHVMLSSVLEADMLKIVGSRAAKDIAMHRDVALRAFGMLEKYKDTDNTQRYDWSKNLEHRSVEDAREYEEIEPGEFERVDPSTEVFPPRITGSDD